MIPVGAVTLITYSSSIGVEVSVLVPPVEPEEAFSLLHPARRVRAKNDDNTQGNFFMIFPFYFPIWKTSLYSSEIGDNILRRMSSPAPASI